jgi:uncharacterized protein YggT (Ycf19 family)
MLDRLIQLLFSTYAIGLLFYVVLSFAHHPQATRPRKWLEQFYLPFLLPLRQVFRPVHVGSQQVDFSPLLLLAGILIVRELVRLTL